MKGDCHVGLHSDVFAVNVYHNLPLCGVLSLKVNGFLEGT